MAEPDLLSSEGGASLQERSRAMQASLLGQISAARKDRKLTQAQVSARTGRTRMTIQRAESDLAGVGLSTFVEMALVLGLVPVLKESEGGARALQHKGVRNHHLPAEVASLGLSLEAAFAKGWEAVNAEAQLGFAPILSTLIPAATQEQATAAATAMQWLGTDVGLGFLRNVVSAAGYRLEKAGVRDFSIQGTQGARPKEVLEAS